MKLSVDMVCNCGLRILSCFLAKDLRRLKDEMNVGGVLGGKNLSGNHAEIGVRRGPLEDEVISKPTLIEKPLIKKDCAVAPALRK